MPIFLPQIGRILRKLNKRIVGQRIATSSLVAHLSIIAGIWR